MAAQIIFESDPNGSIMSLAYVVPVSRLSIPGLFIEFGCKCSNSITDGC